MGFSLLHRRRRTAGAWSIELDALAKAAGGALLFGMPLVFTMEMWWFGAVIAPLHLLALLGATLLANLGLARMSGFRPDTGTLRTDLQQAVEAMGIGVGLSLAILVALARIDTSTSLGVLMGVVGLQTVPLSLGAMVGNLVFDPSVGRARDSSDKPSKKPWRELGNDVAATLAGALFLGFSIAPTGEIPMLAAGLSTRHLLAVVALTMLASYVIVFASGFDSSHRVRNVGGLFQRPFSETVLAYLIALVASAALLWWFGQVGGGDPLHWILVQSVVLAVPASLGGAAGRLVV